MKKVSHFRQSILCYRNHQGQLGWWIFRAWFNSWSFAIRNASSSSPIKALKLYSRMHRKSSPCESFSILYALKSCTCLPDNIRSLSIIRHLHGHLLKLGFNSHVYVATSLLHAYCLSAFSDACSLFEEMPERNSVAWNIMITGYSRIGDVKNAFKVFDEMPTRDLASWTALITAYMSNGLCNEGLANFRQMVMVESIANEYLKPDQLMSGSILAGCANMGSTGLVLGKSIHGFAIKNHWELNATLGTCLVDMYAKCGLFKNACLVFDMMKEKNVITWTVLICGAAQHGHGQEALLIFKKMKNAGGKVKPNELTFTGVLTACVHAGLVDNGRRYFRMMIEEYGLRARIQHYGCMVDLFGKAGLLEEAWEVIKTMEFEPNVVIWGSFLTSCKLHRQFEMAEMVVEEVMRMVRPENDGGVYSLIADIYFLSGKWMEAEKVRKIMVEQNVRKVRGSSFIGNGVV